MQVIEIYGSRIKTAEGGERECPFCQRAKAFCEEKGYAFTYYDITDSDALKAEFVTRTNGAQTVPQIFVGIRRLGGFTDMLKLSLAGAHEQIIAGE